MSHSLPGCPGPGARRGSVLARAFLSVALAIAMAGTPSLLAGPSPAPPPGEGGAAAQPPGAGAAPSPVLCGRVTDAAGDPVPEAGVVLGLLARGKASLPSRYLRRWRDRTVVTGSDGAFSFGDLLPGLYRLRATHPVAGTRELSLPLLEGESRCLPDLRLVAPATLRVHLSPPRDPGRRPWKVTLQHRGGEGKIFLSDEAGQVVAEGLEAGLYPYVVTTHGGAIWRKGIAFVERDGLLDLALPSVWMEGRVSVEGRGRPATVQWWSGRIERTFETAPDGTWKILVPHRSGPETFLVRLAGDVPRPLRGLRWQERDPSPGPDGGREEAGEGLTPPGEAGAAGEADPPVVRVDLSLDLGVLEGQVLDAEGRPLAGARIEVSRSGAPSTEVITGGGGGFRVEDIPLRPVGVSLLEPPDSGTRWIRSWSRIVEPTVDTDGSSGAFPRVEVRAPLPPRRLEVHAHWQDGRPLVGAEITLPRIGETAWFRSGSDGIEALHVPPEDLPRFLVATVSTGRDASDPWRTGPRAGGEAVLWSGCLEMVEDESGTLRLEVVVPRQTGVLGVAPPPEASRYRRKGERWWHRGWWVITGDGGLLSPSRLRRWSEERTGVLQSPPIADPLWIPRMAVGSYALVRTEEPEDELRGRLCPRRSLPAGQPLPADGALLLGNGDEPPAAAEACTSCPPLPSPPSPAGPGP